MKLFGKLNDRNPGESGFRSFFYLGIIICLFFLAGVVYYGNQLVLSVVPENNLQVFRFPVNRGETWHYLYIHSVQLTPCEEFFTVRGSEDMLMTYTRLKS